MQVNLLYPSSALRDCLLFYLRGREWIVMWGFKSPLTFLTHDHACMDTQVPTVKGRFMNTQQKDEYLLNFFFIFWDSMLHESPLPLHIYMLLHSLTPSLNCSPHNSSLTYLIITSLNHILLSFLSQTLMLYVLIYKICLSLESFHVIKCVVWWGCIHNKVAKQQQHKHFQNRIGFKIWYHYEVSFFLPPQLFPHSSPCFLPYVDNS